MSVATLVMDLRECLGRIFAGAEEECMPPKAYETEVARHCLMFGYTEQETTCVIKWINVFGSVECCPILDEDHKPDIEALIPMAPESSWTHYEQWMWCVSDRKEVCV